MRLPQILRRPRSRRADLPLPHTVNTEAAQRRHKQRLNKKPRAGRQSGFRAHANERASIRKRAAPPTPSTRAGQFGRSELHSSAPMTVKLTKRDERAGKRVKNARLHALAMSRYSFQVAADAEEQSAMKSCSGVVWSSLTCMPSMPITAKLLASQRDTISRASPGASKSSPPRTMPRRLNPSRICSKVILL